MKGGSGGRSHTAERHRPTVSYNGGFGNALTLSHVIIGKKTVTPANSRNRAARTASSGRVRRNGQEAKITTTGEDKKKKNRGKRPVTSFRRRGKSADGGARGVALLFEPTRTTGAHSLTGGQSPGPGGKSGPSNWESGLLNPRS